MAGLLDRIFLFLATPAEALVATETSVLGGAPSSLGSHDDIRSAELASPVDAESYESSGVVSPDTVSESEHPSGRTYAEMQMADLRKGYLNLLLAIFAADLGHLFATPANARHFEALVASVLKLAQATGAADLQQVKLAINVMTRMVDAWAAPGPAVPPPPTPAAAERGRPPLAQPAGGSRAAAAPALSEGQALSVAKVHEVFPEVDRMVLERLLPAAFTLPIVANIKPNDAEATLVVGATATAVLPLPRRSA